MQILHYSTAFSQTIQVTRIIGSYAEAVKIYLTPRGRAAALQGERLGNNEDFFAGGHSKLVFLFHTLATRVSVSTSIGVIVPAAGGDLEAAGSILKGLPLPFRTHFPESKTDWMDRKSVLCLQMRVRVQLPPTRPARTAANRSCAQTQN